MRIEREKDAVSVSCRGARGSFQAGRSSPLDAQSERLFAAFRGTFFEGPGEKEGGAIGGRARACGGGRSRRRAEEETHPNAMDLSSTRSSSLTNVRLRESGVRSPMLTGHEGFRAERARPWLQGLLPAVHVPEVHARDVVRAAHAPAVLLLVELQIVECPARRVRQHRARRAGTRGRGERGTHAPSRAEIGSRATAERSAVGERPGGTRAEARGARVARRHRGRERGPRERGGRHRAEPTARRPRRSEGYFVLMTSILRAPFQFWSFQTG